MSSAEITWTEDRVFPKFSTPEHLYVLDARGLSPSEKVMVTTLQGLVNREKPEIFIIDQDVDVQILRYVLADVPYTRVESAKWLIEKYIDKVEGLVLFDLAYPHSINVACTMAGIHNAVACSRLEIERYFRDWDLPIIDDLGKYLWMTDIEAYQWMYDNLRDKANCRILTGSAPGMFSGSKDHVVALRTMHLYIEIPVANSPGGRLFREFLKLFPPDSLYLGWYPADVHGENMGVRIGSEHAIYTTAYDWSRNLTVYAGFDFEGFTQDHATEPVDGEILVSFFVFDGDNSQYNVTFMGGRWLDEGRGSVPIGWSMQPLLADLSPKHLEYFQNTKTENDYFITGPSGVGYMNPSFWPKEHLDKYLLRAKEYLDKVDVNIVWFYDGPGGSYSKQVIEEYSRILEPAGIIVGTGDAKGLPYLTSNKVPVVYAVNAGSSVMSAWQAIGQAVRDQKVLRHKTQFVGVFFSPWNWTPSQMKELADRLSSQYKVVRPDEFFVTLKHYLEN